MGLVLYFTLGVLVVSGLMYYENKTNDEFSTLNVSASAAISLYQLSIK